MSSPLMVPLIHAAATWAMVGLIWFVQVVHYPLFERVGHAGFAGYAAAHQRQTTWVVGPPMLVELLTTVWLLAHRPAGVPAWIVWSGAGLLAVVWLSTAALQVPAHGLLSRGFDPAAAGRLVTTNWLRTLAWTARGLLALWLIVRVT